MKDEKDLFYEIKDVLHAHEDAYVPGAWEEFVKKKKRRPGIIFMRIAAAAAILLFVGYVAWLFVPLKPDTEDHQTKNTTKPPYNYPKNNLGHDSLIANHAAVPQKNTGGNLTTATPLTAIKPPVANQAPSSQKAIYPLLPENNKADKPNKPIAADNIAEIVISKKDSTAVVTNNQPSNNIDAPSVIKPDLPAVVKTEPKRYDRGAQRLNYDSLANLNKPKPLATDKKKSQNLSYALMVSPSVGNQKMNFGTGVEVAYNINKNFSVSSGVSYAYVNAGSNRNAAPVEASQNYSLQGYSSSFSTKAADATSLSAARSSQSVQGVKLALSGLEVPLNFQYKTKGGFYLSAGVSAMSVIGNDLSYNYISNRAVSTPSANGLTNNISVITEETTQKSPEKLTGYVGFYTLSAGKKLNFGRGKLHFAPFIKIPFTRVSSENIQLIHGGVQLGFGF